MDELNGETMKVYYLDSSTYNDTHEEIRDNTSYDHHQAFDNSDTGVEAYYKE